MCMLIKEKKSVFVHFEQHDTSSKFIYPSYQGCTTSDNATELEEQTAVTPVQEYDTHKALMHQPTLDQKLSLQNPVPEKHTEAS